MLLHSPQANLAIFMSCGNAVIFWVTGDAHERVLASLLVVFFEEKPINNPHKDRHTVLLNIHVFAGELGFVNIVDFMIHDLCPT